LPLYLPLCLHCFSLYCRCLSSMFPIFTLSRPYFHSLFSSLLLLSLIFASFLPQSPFLSLSLLPLPFSLLPSSASLLPFPPSPSLIPPPSSVLPLPFPFSSSLLPPPFSLFPLPQSPSLIPPPSTVLPLPFPFPSSLLPPPFPLFPLPQSPSLIPPLSSVLPSPSSPPFSLLNPPTCLPLLQSSRVPSPPFSPFSLLVLPLPSPFSIYLLVTIIQYLTYKSSRVLRSNFVIKESKRGVLEHLAFTVAGKRLCDTKSYIFTPSALATSTIGQLMFKCSNVIMTTTTRLSSSVIKSCFFL
jgi:hypothetical protein